MNDEGFHCWSCNQEIAITMPVGRSESCASCSADVRCCRNCNLFEPNAHNSCREPASEVVQERDRSNFCGYFQPARGRRKQDDGKDEAKAKLEALFQF